MTIPYYYFTYKRGKPPSKRTSLLCRLGLQLSAGALFFTNVHVNCLMGSAYSDNSTSSHDPIFRNFHGDIQHRLLLLSYNRSQYDKVCSPPSSLMQRRSAEATLQPVDSMATVHYKSKIAVPKTLILSYNKSRPARRKGKMKKRNVINLIRYYSEHNDPAFRTEAYEIARDFDASGDYQLAEYVMAMLSDTNTFVPQTDSDSLGTDFLQKLPYTKTPLPLSKPIADDVRGVINAVGHNVGVNKFIFQGPPGTGKTETARQIARVLGRETLIVDFSSVIDSKLGQTSKNIVALFGEIDSLADQGGYLVLFDEIDALALDRTDSRDVREMGRATSTFLRELERLNPQMVIIATTNLFEKLDKAIVRRFDAVIDFSRYTREDLVEIAEKITNNLLTQFDYAGKNTRLLQKIVQQADDIPMPGDLTNMIRTSLAFSDPDNEFSYLQRLYKATVTKPTNDIRELKERGYTVREIEILTGVPKSTVSREIKGA